MEKMTAGRKVILILFILNVLFIWFNSALDTQHTFYFSDKITDKVVESSSQIGSSAGFHKHAAAVRGVRRAALCIRRTSHDSR